MSAAGVAVRLIVEQNAMLGLRQHRGGRLVTGPLAGALPPRQPKALQQTLDPAKPLTQTIYPLAQPIDPLAQPIDPLAQSIKPLAQSIHFPAQ